MAFVTISTSFAGPRVEISLGNGIRFSVGDRSRNSGNCMPIRRDCHYSRPLPMYYEVRGVHCENEASRIRNYSGAPVVAKFRGGGHVTIPNQTGW
jgi:hypothetical protein